MATYTASVFHEPALYVPKQTPGVKRRKVQPACLFHEVVVRAFDQAEAWRLVVALVARRGWEAHGIELRRLDDDRLEQLTRKGRIAT